MPIPCRKRKSWRPFSRPTSPAQPARPHDLHGSALFRGTVRGSLQRPQLSGQLTARDLRVMGSQFRLLRVNVDAGPGQVSLENGELDPVPSGKLTFDVRAALHRWSYAPENSLTISAHASQLSLADLIHAVGVQAPLTGILNADVDVKGSRQVRLGAEGYR